MGVMDLRLTLAPADLNRFRSHPVLRGFKQGVVDKLTSGVGQVGKMRKVKFIQGRATLSGPKSMTIAGASGETELQFQHCILATGSSPTRVPSLAMRRAR